LEIIRCLEESDIVNDFKVLAFETFESGFFLKIKANLINEIELFIREYSDINERDYSYHLQDKNKKLIMRWDNATRHKQIETFPHHLHHGKHIFPSFEISCDEI